MNKSTKLTLTKAPLMRERLRLRKKVPLAKRLLRTKPRILKKRQQVMLKKLRIKLNTLLKRLSKFVKNKWMLLKIRLNVKL